MLNDAKLAGNPARVDFGSIKVPTLIISTADDRFGTAATARDIAAAVPDPSSSSILEAGTSGLDMTMNCGERLRGSLPPSPQRRNRIASSAP